MNKKLKKLFTTPNLYFYDYFAKRVERKKKGGGKKKSGPVLFHAMAKGPSLAHLETQLASCLQDRSIRYFYGGDDDRTATTIHIDADHIPSLLKILQRGSGVIFSPLYISMGNGSIEPLKAVDSESLIMRGNFTILCAEKTPTSSHGTTKTVSCLHIVSWKEENNYSLERIMLCGKTNSLVSRLRRRTFEAYATKNINLNMLSSAKLAGKCSFPIDAVYTWVDSSDPAWLEKKSSYDTQTTDSVEGRALHPERFRNNNELLYSLRSLEMFAPFVRQVFLVTDNQTPEWLKTSNPRLRIVSHQDIYRDRSVLPTFNSSGIETQLHHIDGLAEHFLYFNDDMFLGFLCQPEDFFLGNGMMKYFPSTHRVHTPDIDDSREEYIIADRNIIRLLEKEHGSFSTEIMVHAPYPSRNSYLHELESRYSSAFSECAAQRFRSPRDIRPIAFAQYHFGFQEGRAVPAKISNRYLALWKPNIGKQFDELLHKRDVKTFCINDVGVPADEIAKKTMIVNKFLKTYFPFKSSFEV
jgi:hypothetical protein